jgi:F0F1-type ATP synthase assembly protein I
MEPLRRRSVVERQVAVVTVEADSSARLQGGIRFATKPCYNPRVPPEDLTRPDRESHDVAARRRTEAEIRVGWKMAAVGMEVAAQVAGGALLGWGIDAIFGTSWGVLTGAIIGLIVGMWTLIKGALKLNKQLESMGPRPRNLATTESSDETSSAKDDLPSWREEWEEWKDDDGDGAQRDN